MIKETWDKVLSLIKQSGDKFFLQLGGVPISLDLVLDGTYQVFPEQWVIIKGDRFITYEESDLDWLLYFGFAKKLDSSIIQMRMNSWEMPNLKEPPGIEFENSHTIPPLRLKVEERTHFQLNYNQSKILIPPPRVIR